MLVLARKLGQSIVIGEGDDQVVIRIAEIQGDKVRLGIEAPKRIVVDRLEIHERKNGTTQGS